MTSSLEKTCFNSNCGQVLKEEAKEGWLCRTGELAQLCDRCSSAFKDGKFCETYHLNTSGWRCCESCGKQIHCGCIVSFHMFILLDAGGIECLNCAKTEYILTPNPTWPSASHNLPGPAEKIRDISSKNWKSIAENPVTWRQTPNLSSASKAQPESPASHHPPGSAERIKDISSKVLGCIPESILRWRQTPNLSSASKAQPESQCSGPVPWRQAPSLFSGSKAQPESQCRTPFDVNIDKSLAKEQWSCCSLGKSTTGDPSQRLVNENRKARDIQYEWQRDLFKDASCRSFFNPTVTPLSSVPATTSVAHDQKTEIGNVSGTNVQRPCLPPIVGKPCPNNNGAGPSLEAQAHSAKARGEIQILPQHCPRATDLELQQISGGSNAKVTPLFEKQLSASDVSRIGRLVLPKRCAEAHFPRINVPEGCRLVFQDLNGKDWVLHYRFWLNNNSRMYVLEGFAPFVRSMQLQAGDSVTFSRLEPEGKLVMGFRKVSLASPWDLGDETTSTSHSTHEEPSKDSIASKSRNPDGIWSEADNNSNPAKRMKVDNVCSDNKHLKNEQEIIQISVTLEQVQELLRPPLTNSPTIVLIEGFEFEDFQEAPIIGTPTNGSMNHVESPRSKMVEPTPKHLEQMLPMINNASSSKKNASDDSERVMTIEGFGAFSDLASSQATIRHPRHKHGCTCIVCVQPPSGTKHKSTCTCNVCLVFKRSIPPSVMPHGQKRVENQVGCSMENPNQSLYADVIRHYQMGINSHNQKVAGGSERFESDPYKDKSSASSFKSQNIDLNIQPEREEEFHPVSESIGIMRLVQESTQRYMRQQKQSINGAADGNHGNHAL